MSLSLCFDAELKSWHEDLAWEQQTKRFAKAWEVWQQQQGNAEHVQQFVLMQHSHMVDFCKSWLSLDSTNLGVKQLQRFVAAVSRITLRQQMHLVFAGYKGRFVHIGARTRGMKLLYFVSITLLLFQLEV